MKIIFLITLIFASSAFAYVDMSDVTNRALDLGLPQIYYEFLMGLSGILTGFVFALFVWKIR